MLTENTVTKLQEMHLSAMAKAFKDQMTDPNMAGVSFEDRFGLLVDHEWTTRKNNHLKRLIKNAGFAEAVWTAIGLAVGTYLNWLLVAKRIRIYSEKTKSNTIPSFLSDRFGDKAGFLTAIAAVVIIVFFVPYTASGFSAIGKLASTLFDVDYHTVMIVGAIILVSYTVLGGFLAASITDFIQSIVMTIALFVVVCFGIESAGGMSAIGESILGIEGVDSFGQYFSLTGTDGSFGFLPIVSTLAWGLGYFGMPHILLRFMAIEDKNKLKISRRVGSAWVVISMGIAIFIGILGYSFVVNNDLMNADFDAEKIVVYFANAIAGLDSFGAIIAGIIIAGILASIMSTADSQLLAASSSVSENLIKRFAWKNMKDKTQMWFARGSVVVIAIVAIILAWNPDSSVFRIVSFAWAGFGAAFGPIILFALFWKRTNKWGALAGIADALDAQIVPFEDFAAVDSLNLFHGDVIQLVLQVKPLQNAKIHLHMGHVVVVHIAFLFPKVLPDGLPGGSHFAHCNTAQGQLHAVDMMLKGNIGNSLVQAFLVQIDDLVGNALAGLAHTGQVKHGGIGLALGRIVALQVGVIDIGLGLYPTDKINRALVTGSTALCQQEDILTKVLAQQHLHFAPEVGGDEQTVLDALGGAGQVGHDTGELLGFIKDIQQLDAGVVAAFQAHEHSGVGIAPHLGRAIGIGSAAAHAHHGAAEGIGIGTGGAALPGLQNHLGQALQQQVIHFLIGGDFGVGTDGCALDILSVGRQFAFQQAPERMASGVGNMRI